MDPMPIDDLLTRLDESDPADAPETADVIAASLSEELETDEDEIPPAAPA